MKRIGCALILSLFAACDGTSPTTEHLGASGVAPKAEVVASEALVEFVNDDSAPHQMVSDDCPELESDVMAPGDTFDAQLGPGPKTCTYRDAAVPSYGGTLQVLPPPVEPNGG